MERLLCRAKIGGIQLAEVNSLEILFLFGINFDLMVTTEEYLLCSQDLSNPQRWSNSSPFFTRHTTPTTESPAAEHKYHGLTPLELSAASPQLPCQSAGLQQPLPTKEHSPAPPGPNSPDS